MSVIGVAGLTLGGGLGVMMRTHGLSCDNSALDELFGERGPYYWS